jgi:predicted Fe-S protein YdhL (DUF1289 family)
MAPTPRCVIDRSRPCGGCLASGPDECPYAYLVADERAELLAAAREHGAQVEAARVAALAPPA